ncbi:MAG: hypothetical protein WKF37_07315 [Bryobacteraceae bacterium]
MRTLSTPDGVIAAPAMDQRKSLRRMLAEKASVSPEAISDQQLADFKTSVTRILSAHSSAILLDPEFDFWLTDTR